MIKQHLNNTKNRKVMKKNIILLSLTLLTASAWAQQSETKAEATCDKPCDKMELRKERPSETEMAKKKTERMTKALNQIGRAHV